MTPFREYPTGQDYLADISHAIMESEAVRSHYLNIINRTNEELSLSNIIFIINNILSNSGPVMILLIENLDTPAENQHAVLAYTYYDAPGSVNDEILVYDPNYPGDHGRSIKFNDSRYVPYESLRYKFEWLTYMGDSSFPNNVMAGFKNLLDNNLDPDEPTSVPQVKWEKIFHTGESSTEANSICLAPDGGFVVVGEDDHDQGLILRLDSQGNFMGEKVLGSTGSEALNSVIQTSLGQGGYVAVGYSSSRSSSSDPSARPYNQNNGGEDGWAVRLDPAGNVTIGGEVYTGSRVYGDPKDNRFYDVSLFTGDYGDGYLLAGSSSTGQYGKYYGWIVQLEGDGTKSLELLSTGENNDYSCFHRVEPTNPGYIAAGVTARKYWVIKVNWDNTVAWEKIYNDMRGSGGAYALCKTQDGGYIIGGEEGHVFKLDSNGNTMWRRQFYEPGRQGQSGFEIDCRSIIETSDGGIVLTGGGGVFESGPSIIMKLNSDGSDAWKEPVNFPAGKYSKSIAQTQDGGFVVAGHLSDGGIWVAKIK
jgi:hypothetical protein